MELSLARLINCLVSKPQLIAEIAGNVEAALSMGDVAPTNENKAAVAIALRMISKQHKSAGLVKLDPIIGWDGGPFVVPASATPST